MVKKSLKFKSSSQNFWKCLLCCERKVVLMQIFLWFKHICFASPQRKDQRQLLEVLIVVQYKIVNAVSKLNIIVTI